MLFECAIPECAVRNEISLKKSFCIAPAHLARRILSVFVHGLAAQPQNAGIEDSARTSIHTSG